MSDTVTVQGAETLVRTLRRADDRIHHLETVNHQVARTLTARARAAAPRRSGFLSASGRELATADYAAVEFTAVYAGVINFGWPARNITPQPFATGAVRDSQPQVLAMYGHELDSILDDVKGA